MDEPEGPWKIPYFSFWRVLKHTPAPSVDRIEISKRNAGGASTRVRAPSKVPVPVQLTRVGVTGYLLV